MTINVTLPTCWAELTQEQLRMAYQILETSTSTTEAQTLVMLAVLDWDVEYMRDGRWSVHCGKTHFVTTAEDMSRLVGSMAWVTEQLGREAVCIEEIDGATAMSRMLYGATLEEYLTCENLYQGFLVTRDSELVRRMAEVLYRKPGIRIAKYEETSVVCWWSGVKEMFATQFGNFMKPVENAVQEEIDIMEAGRRAKESMNAIIRALTKGDVTKNAAVLAAQVWDCFVELDAICRESDELKKSRK